MNEWISVKDRLPESSGDYLVVIELENITLQQVLGFSARHQKFNASDSLDTAECPINDVTHWMSLPEFPEEVDTNQRKEDEG